MIAAEWVVISLGLQVNVMVVVLGDGSQIRQGTCSGTFPQATGVRTQGILPWWVRFCKIPQPFQPLWVPWVQVEVLLGL